VRVIEGGKMSKMSLLNVVVASASAVGLPAAMAGDIGCGGEITRLMADHSGCGGNMAFTTTSTGTVWMCAKSKEANAMLLAAQAAGKPVTVYIEGGDVAGCTALPAYRLISYVITYP
jgi:hypothetical protein